MNTYFPPASSIKAWAEEDRPREKLLRKGKQHLTDAELLAILLRTGTADTSAVELARQILQSVNYDLNELGNRPLPKLMSCKGIGEAKALAIAAAMELGRRRQLSVIREKPQIRGSQDAFNAIGSLLSDLLHEEFWILLLNRANRVIGKEQISSGGMTGTVVDAKIIFRKAIEGRACAIILCHNHPSGNLSPSQADIDLTRKLVKAGEMVELPVLDHLIIGGTSYWSFADEGML